MQEQYRSFRKKKEKKSEKIYKNENVCMMCGFSSVNSLPVEKKKRLRCDHENVRQN